MKNDLLRKSVSFAMVLVMVAMMFAPVTMNVSATCPYAGEKGQILVLVTLQ